MKVLFERGLSWSSVSREEHGGGFTKYHFPGPLVTKLYFPEWRRGERIVLSALTQADDKSLFQKLDSWELCGM